MGPGVARWLAAVNNLISGQSAIVNSSRMGDHPGSVEYRVEFLPS